MTPGPVRRKAPLRRRLRNAVVVTVAACVLVAVNGPHVVAATDTGITAYRESRQDYRAAMGSWRTVELPPKYRVNAIHAVLLHTGKVLLIAGSGNDQRHFDAGTFSTMLWDPSRNTFTTVPTPKDLFCGGHAFLPNGNVLIAGGTRRYEILADKVTHAAGVMTVHNESPAVGPLRLPAGTRFAGPDGTVYRTTEKEVVVPPAESMGEMIHPATVQTWVEAVEQGPAAAFRGQGRQFTVAGLDAATSANVYGTADTITLDKQEYQGLDASYEFDVRAERYVETGRLNVARWYPTLVGIQGGNVLAVSGLDRYGVISGGTNELYRRDSRRWSVADDLERYFPTYPALFRMADNRLFYSGSNAGYGSATKGRKPGIWNLGKNSWHDVPGLRDAQMTETSSSVLLPPAQDQKVMIFGGGEVGDRPESTDRVDVVDLDAGLEPRYEPGPSLLRPTRYLNTVILPDDTVFLTGGSTGYRGEGASDLKLSAVYEPRSGALEEVAPNHIGRNYHSEALLLPDGRVITLGSDPLYADEDDSIAGTFEQRVEIYTPAYLYRGPGPRITSSPRSVNRGSTFEVGAQGGVQRARLVRPSAVTHVTDVEQRSVALDVTPVPGGARLTLDEREGITPSGWYMLFLVNEKGVPSRGTWISVG